MSDFPDKSRKRFMSITEDLEDGEIIDTQSNEVELKPPSDKFVVVDPPELNGLQNREKELYQQSLCKDDVQSEQVDKSQLARENSPKEHHSADTEVKDRSKARRLRLDEKSDSKKRENAIGRLMTIRHKMITKQNLEKSKAVDEMYLHPPSAKKVKLKATDIYSDDSSNSGVEVECSGQDVEENHEVRLVSTLDELSRSVLTRKQLENFMDKPIFEQTITNCFVRVNIGLPGIDMNQVYRISQIAGLEQSKRDYSLSSRRTNLILRLRHTGQYVYTQMDVVSNQPVTPLEFDLWMSTCQREGCQLPSLALIEKKARDIEEASKYCFTEGDVEKLVQIKRKEGKKTVSAAYKKVCMIMERDMAVDWNDLETANRLEKRIQKMDRNPKPNREHSIESLRIAQLPYVLPTKKFLADRLPKSSDFDLERYMRRKYKKSALVSRARVDAEEFEDDDASISMPSKDMDNDCKKTVHEEELQKLDLYKLHEFDVVLDVSSLAPIGTLLKDIKI